MILMTVALLVAVREVGPASLRVAPTVAATLRPIHSRWMNETLRGLAPVLSPSADFWSGWSAVRYLNDQFDWQYRCQRTLVAAIMPLLRPANALLLGARTETLDEVRHDLDRLGRRQGMTAVTAALAYGFLSHLRAWFAMIQRVTRGLTANELSSQGRRAIAQLGPTSPGLRGTRE